MKTQSNNMYRKIAKILIAVFIVFYLLPFLSGLLQIGSYFIIRKLIPAGWCIFLVLMSLFVPRVHPSGKISKRDTIYMESVVCAVILIALQILLGSILGELGGSPYDLSPMGIMGNLFFVLPALAGREMVRSYVLGVYCSKPNLKVFITLTLLMTVLSLNYSRLDFAQEMEGFAIFLATEAGPQLSVNIMLSYLALYGGSLAAILYIFVQVIFHWLSPILSSLNWLAEGAVGILVPLVCILFIIGKYEDKKRRFGAEKSHRNGTIGWLVTGAFSIGLLWFVAGVFPIIPSVIVTGSMEPVMQPGDVIIIRQMQTEEQIQNLEEGDVIQFQRDDIRITHRIIEIIDDGIGNLSFRTKGDNNSSEDSRPVQPNDVKGTLVKVIPKLGYPSLLIKSAGQEGRSDIEF